MKKMLAAAAVAIGLSFAAGGAAQAQNMSDWSSPQMRSVLTELGAKITYEGYDDDGAPLFNATSDKGLKFEVSGTVCSGQRAAARCKGAMLASDFVLDNENEARSKAEQVNTFAAVGVRLMGKEFRVYRYLIFDDGVSRGNLKVNVSVFLGVAHQIWDKI